MRTLLTIKAGLLALAFASLSTTPTTAQPIEFEAATAGLIEVTAKVDAIDKKERLITITGPRGNTIVLQAGPR